MRFRGSRAAYGSSSYSEATVPKEFLRKLTELNRIWIYGRTAVDEIVKAHRSSDRKEAHIVRSADNFESEQSAKIFTTAPGQAHDDKQTNQRYSIGQLTIKPQSITLNYRKPMKRAMILKNNIEYEINNATDFWLWFDTLGYFDTIEVKSTNEFSYLQLQGR